MLPGRWLVRRLIPLVAVALAPAAAPAYAALTSSAASSTSFAAATLAAPTGVAVTWTCNAGSVVATIDWALVTHADRYDVWWTTDPNLGWQLVDTVTAPPLAHQPAVTPNTTVHHRVVARAATNWSSPATDVQTTSGSCGGGGGGGGGGGNGPGGPPR